MSLRKSTSLIEEGVGENPNPFSNNFISNDGKVFKIKDIIRNKIPLNTAIYKFTAGTRTSTQCLKNF